MFAGSGGHGHSHGGSGGHGHSHGGKAKGSHSHSHSHEGNEDHGHSHEGGGKHGHSHEGGAHGHSHGNTNSGQLHADDDGDHDEPESGELPLTPLGDSAPGSSKTIVQLQVGETYKAKRDYTPTKDKYLSMKKGDLVFVVSSIKPNLYIGRVNGEEGRFNAKRVKIPSGENITPSALSLTETLELKPPADFDQDLEKGLGPKTQHEGGHNMKAVFLHVLGDALGSVGVIFVSLMIWLTDLSWKYYLDPVISLVITAIIVYGTVPLVKQTALVLLQGVPDFDFAGLRASLRNLVGVKGVHEVHVWRLADNKLVGSAHLMVEDLQDGAQVSMKAKKVFHQYDVHSSTIQTECLRVVGSDSETDVEDTSDTACLISCEKDCAEKGCCPPSASQSARERPFPLSVNIEEEK